MTFQCLLRYSSIFRLRNASVRRRSCPGPARVLPRSAPEQSTMQRLKSDHSATIGVFIASDTCRMKSHCCQANLKSIIKSIEKQKALAKCEMGLECSDRDAEEMIEIMKAVMVDCHENELSSIDGFSENQSGSRASSKSGQIKRLVGRREK